MEKRNLAEVLKELGDQEVCIGAVDGSCYMYFGKASNIDEITSVFETYREHRAKDLERITRELIMTCNEKPLVNDEEGHDILVDYTKYADTVKHYSDSRIRLKLYLDTYKNVLERTVKDVFLREAENITAIHITGKEAGQYWLSSEYKSQK